MLNKDRLKDRKAFDAFTARVQARQLSLKSVNTRASLLEDQEAHARECMVVLEDCGEMPDIFAVADLTAFANDVLVPDHADMIERLEMVAATLVLVAQELRIAKRS